METPNQFTEIFDNNKRVRVYNKERTNKYTPMKIEVKFYQSIAGFAAGTGLLLLIPLIAMQFTEEVVWTMSDFVIAGIFLFGTGLIYKLVTRRSSKLVYRVAIGFTLFTGLFLVW